MFRINASRIYERPTSDLFFNLFNFNVICTYPKTALCLF